MKEIYKDVVGYEGRYTVSNYGNIKCYFQNGTVIKRQLFTSYGYKRIGLQGKKFMVHRLVVEAFIGPIPTGYEVNHIDSDRSNNKISNLEICTPSENMKHAFKYGSVKIPDNKGSKHVNSKLTEKDVLQIRTLHQKGIRQIDIQKKFSFVNKAAINKIVNRQRWTHI